jgi:hypothetical protein
MTIRLLAVLAAAFSLSGCLASFGGKQFENRLTMTTACDELRTDSQYMGIGISSAIAARDAKPVLDALCGQKAPAAPVPASPASPASAAK